VQPALDMIARHDFDVMVMATHRFSFADTKEAFDLVAEYRDGVVKALIEFD
jgi:threonine dehydrogenase-like Zn-dependent dehydrogenase